MGAIAFMIQSAVAATVKGRLAPFVTDGAFTAGLADQGCGIQW
jgi:hypothetical protein